MVLLYPSFPVEMILEIGDVGFSSIRFGKELVVRRDVHSRGLDLQLHSRRTCMQ